MAPSDETTLKFWHGAQRWSSPPQLKPSRPKSYECGPGLYLSSRLATARKYARGPGQTVLVELSPDLVLLENTRLTLEQLLEGLDQLPRVRARKEIVDGLKQSAQRHPDNRVPAAYLLNYCVNNDALGGESGPALARWFTEQGIDASLHHQPGEEDWLVVFNLSKILRTRVLPSAAAWDLGDFPSLRNQLSALPSAPAASPPRKAPGPR